MDSYSTSELCFQQTQTTMDDSFCQPPPQLVDDFGITAENVDRLADELDLELLREFFGSSLGEDLAKDACVDDSPSSSSSIYMTSTAFPSPSAPSTSTSTPSTASPSSSTTAPATVNTRKRKATQDRSCVNCKTPESSMWRRDPESGDTLCNACGQHLKKFKVHRPAAMFNRPLKKRCRKTKDEAPPALSIQVSPMCHFNFGTVPHFQQPQQQVPPQYPYYHQPQPIQPQFPMQPFQQPPPDAYHAYNNWQSHPSYPLPPYFQQGHW